MQEDIKLLEAVVKCGEMGTGTLDHLAGVNGNGAFAASMRVQQDEYEALRGQAAGLLAAMGRQPAQLTAMERLSTSMGVKMNTLADKSTRHLAEMLIQGSTMGIVDLTKALRDNPGASAEARNLADRMLHTMQRDVEELKLYL